MIYIFHLSIDDSYIYTYSTQNVAARYQLDTHIVASRECATFKYMFIGDGTAFVIVYEASHHYSNNEKGRIYPYQKEKGIWHIYQISVKPMIHVRSSYTDVFIVKLD